MNAIRVKVHVGETGLSVHFAGDASGERAESRPHSVSQNAAVIFNTILQCFIIYILATVKCSCRLLVDGVARSAAEWLACWTSRRRVRVHVAVATLSGNSLRQSVHTYRVSVHQAAKLVAALLRVAGVTAGLAESNSSLLTSPVG